MGRAGHGGRVVAAFALGACMATTVGAVAREGDAVYRKLRIFTQVFGNIEQQYVEPVGPDQLVHGAIKGMMETLDPHSAYMPPDEYKKLQEDTAGEFGGLGLEITEKDGAIVVVAPIEGAPAARAGIERGDKIVGVDGKALAGVALHDVWKLLRGLAGTRVVVRILRAGWAEPRDVALVREKVKLQAVESACPEPGLGHVRIKQFQERVGRDVETALATLNKTCRPPAADSLKGLVLDLRGNPGGLLDEAVRVADAFLWEGDIVTTEGRGRRVLNRQVAHPRDTQPNYPMVVLVDESSASASEIVAGALQDHARAVVMGVPTFGKGSVQTLMELEDGSGLKLTVARYFTPSGRSIQERGITPDIRVEAPVLPEGDEAHTPAAPLREKDLNRHLKNTSRSDASAVPAPPADPQLRAALEHLKAFQILSKNRVGTGTLTP